MPSHAPAQYGELQALDRRHREPADYLERLHRRADEDHEHPRHQDSCRDQHLPVRQLALEHDRQPADGERRGEPEHDAGQDGEDAGLERQRLEEEHGLEALPIHAGEAQSREPEHLRRDEADMRAAQDPLLALVEVRQMLIPVDPVVEPVQDQQQGPDRDHGDDRFQLLAVASERAEDGLRDDPGDPRGHQREGGADQERAPVAPGGADHARHQSCEDQDRLEPLAEDHDCAVRDHGGSRAARADTERRLLELGLQRGDRLFELRPRVLPLDELHEPGLPAIAVPEETLDPLEQRRCDSP